MTAEPAHKRSTMMTARNDCSVAQDPPSWHGGLIEVSTARPGLTAAYEAPVSPATSDNAPFGTPRRTLPLTRGSCHMLARVPRRNTSSFWPTRKQ
jgi:hypothetical protein